MLTINRLAGRIDDFESDGPEFYIVSCNFGYIYVSREMAHALVKQLQRIFPPTFVWLRDLSGSEMWLQRSQIELIGESTPAQREHDRKLRRALNDEDKEWR